MVGVTDGRGSFQELLLLSLLDQRGKDEVKLIVSRLRSEVLECERK